MAPGPAPLLLLLLRVAVFCEFVGHGAFGLRTKAGWVPFFGLFGIGEADAYRLMPLVGALDVTLGVSALLAPLPAVLLWMTGWGLFTALLRPLAGQGPWEFVERAYNFGVPGLFLLLAGAGARPRWFVPIRSLGPFDDGLLTNAHRLVRATVVAMLVGHGFVTLAKSPGLAGAQASTAIAAVDFGLAFAALASGARPLLVAIAAWKLTTEFLHVTAGVDGAGWEWIERGGAYAAPLAGAMLPRPGRAAP